jgi:hypothetical protein
MEETGLFHEIDVRRYRWNVEYTADEWADVLRTYSPNIARDPATTERLLQRIKARIGARTVTKHYLATLNLGRRPG